MKTPCVVILCYEYNLIRERRGYFRAFSKHIKTIYLPTTANLQGEKIQDLIPDDLNPILLLKIEGTSFLPADIASVPIPTACFQIDTYRYTRARIYWSKLFDYAFVSHPQYEQAFQQAGVSALCLPHAVEAELFQGPDVERIYDVGWVGSLNGKIYSIRRRYINALNDRFYMNEVDRRYSAEEMAKIYQQSKIVVNISRDDYLQDANLRCFEAMASGALLVTPNPTELADLGFIEGIHYVGFSSEADLLEKVKFYLEHPNERQTIAAQGRSLVLSEHTYDRRAEKILHLIQNGAARNAPARRWTPAQVHQALLHYFANRHLLDASLAELKTIRQSSWAKSLFALPTFLFSFSKALFWALKG